MKRECPNFECLRAIDAPIRKRLVRKGFFLRSSDGQRIPRYRCRQCRRSFSSATELSVCGQKKRRLNVRVFELLNSGVSQRRAAQLLRVNRKTVVRKFRFLADEARNDHAHWLRREWEEKPAAFVQLDDLETSEHSKCKPLSVALAVEPNSRKILGFQVSRMPAKGLLAERARKKYGTRRDERPKGWARLLRELKTVVREDAHWLSDQNPHYPAVLSRHFPKAVHTTVLGARGAGTGQGELKKLGFDPLFSLNHTCAMLRANLNRLFRRTWCTTKTQQGLEDHLALYVVFHNRLLTPPRLPAGTG